MSLDKKAEIEYVHILEINRLSNTLCVHEYACLWDILYLEYQDQKIKPSARET